MQKLQTIIFPSVEFPATEDMYFHSGGEGVFSSLSKGVIYVAQHASIYGDTFFNGFSVGKWKEICQIDDLSLALIGKGRAAVRVGIKVLDHACRWLHESEVNLSEDPTIIEISSFPTITDGIIFFQIIALDDVTLSGGYYFTRSSPINDVKLGIVVTHFNRKHYVLPAIRRVTEQLLKDPEMEQRISMVVVDNSQNITPEEIGGAIVIPNPNLGGAGGFTRGLLYVKDSGFTHCLFMDDDASCEIEAIRRTFRIMQFAKSPKVAIAGSMMREDTPTFIHEAGATWRDCSLRSLKRGLDTRNWNDLLRAEARVEKIDFGAWWHFAFRVDQVKRFAFPFFVRGDDILFSLSNDFDIHTMNGIGGWAEAFEVKESPFVRYLSLRADIVLGLLQSSRSGSRLGRWYRRRVRHSLFSYNYSSARAFTIAMQHVMQGPDFWLKNADMVAVREELAQFCPGEKIDKVIMPGNLETSFCHERQLSRFIRKVTLNGFLLPEFMIRDKTTLDRKKFDGDAYKIFRNRQVLYTVPNGNTGYLAEYNKPRFWTEYWLARRTSREFERKFEKLRLQYREAFPELSSEASWRAIFHRFGGK